jgi:hypothetical protein
VAAFMARSLIGRFAMSISNDSPSLLCRGSSHPLDALPAYPVRPSSQSPVQDLSTAYSDGMRRPVSAGCIKLPRIDALVAQRKGDRL